MKSLLKHKLVVILSLIAVVVIITSIFYLLYLESVNSKRLDLINKNLYDKLLADGGVSLAQSLDAKTSLIDQITLSKDGLEKINKAIALLPNRPEAYYCKGLYLLYTGDYNESLKEFNTAITIKPSAILYEEKGRDLFYIGKFDEAVVAYQTAISLKPNNNVTQDYEYLAEAYNIDAIKNNLPKLFYNALEASKACIALDRDNLNCWIHSAMANSKLNNCADASANLYHVSLMASTTQKDQDFVDQSFGGIGLKGTCDWKHDNSAFAKLKY